MDELVKAINKYPNGTKLVVSWHNQLKIEGEIDTIYETDNGLEPEEENYKEFYACILNISNIVNPLSVLTDLTTGSLVEISMQIPPKEVLLMDGSVIWKKSN